MKRLVATFPDDIELDLGSLLKASVSFTIESIIEPPTAPVNRPPRKFGSKHHVPGSTVQKCIMDHFTPQGIFTKLEAIKWTTQAGYSRTSYSNALTLLVAHGFVKQQGPGYIFLKPFEAWRVTTFGSPS